MSGTYVVIPAYNEAQTIAGVIEGVCAAGPERVIVVDDGSGDDTGHVVGELIDVVDSPGRIELIRHQANMGKGQALATGIARALEAGAERIVTIDGDGQHDAADLPRLERAARLAPDALIIAARLREREQAPQLRRFANEVADFWISWACGQRIDDTQSGFRLYPAAVLAGIAAAAQGRGFSYETGLLIAAVGAGARVRSIPIATRYQDGARASHYRPCRDTWNIIRLVGASLLRRGMYPQGLVRSLRRGAGQGQRDSAPLRERD